jgi:integrase
MSRAAPTVLNRLQDRAMSDAGAVTVRPFATSRIMLPVRMASPPCTAIPWLVIFELIENQIVPFLGAKLVQKLKSIDIEAWHTTLKTRGRKDGRGGLANRTIGHAHRVLSKALREAARHDLVTKNVASDEGAPRVDAEDMVILTPEQVGELPAKLAGRAICCRAIVALFTGVRRGELLALRWGRVDLDGKVMRIREAIEQTKGHGIRFKKAKTKSGHRDLVMPDIVVDALRAHRRQQLEQRLALGLGKLPDDALVFPAADGGPMSPRGVSSEGRDAAEAVGLKGVTFHALRHTHASQFIDAGVDVVTISKRLGYASPTITLQIYAHLFRKDDTKAAAAINAALAGPVKA